MIYFAVMTLGSQLVLAADTVPTLNVEPSCRSAATTSIMVGRTAENCLNDEHAARTVLEQIAETLAPDGYLIMGALETSAHQTPAFRPVPGLRGLYVRDPNYRIAA